MEEFGESLGLAATLALELLEKLLDLLHLMLKLHHVNVLAGRCGHLAGTGPLVMIVVEPVFQQFLVLPLLILNFNLLLCKLLTEPNDPLRLVFTAGGLLGGNLDTQLVDISLELPLLLVLRFKFLLDFSDLRMQLFLLMVQLVNLFSKLLLISMTNV